MSRLSALQHLYPAAEDRRTVVFTLGLKDECSCFCDERRQLSSIQIAN
ncbi:hypothetical protein HEAR1426 [Herminiimonas arsenicoxydans]|uniref:Uncharacterized protein n=1 Tax=Herminiimonas arsenicoxydans TaxID=204773 RepID=A4G510_HERAR|nr:hypothetical protein HEAR1426 [Herminiimonas arsenicoxydans]